MGVRALLLTGAAFGFPATVQAQEAQAQDDADASVIIVTAQKREQSILEVPVAVSVISGAELEDRNISRFDEIARLVPNLQFEPGQTPNENSFALRGISAATVAQGLQSSVGVYVDGVYVAGRSALNFDLFDIERIEVLRGPQGTIFGRNAAAGALNIVSAKPGSQWSSRASLEYGNYDTVRATASVGGELGDSGLFVQLGGGYNRNDGWITNQFDGRRLQQLEGGGVRGSIAYRPAESIVHITIAGDYYQERNLSAVTSATPYTREVNVNTLPFNNRDVYGISGTVDVDLDAVKLTSITGFRGYTADRQADNDATEQNTQFGRNQEEVGGLSQELRLASQGGGSFDWLAGLFYYREVNRLISGISLALPTGPAQLTLFNGQSSSRLLDKSVAGFGQASWRFSPKWEITLGARYSDDQQEVDVTRSGFIPRVLSAGNNSFATSSTDFSVKGALRYEIEPNQSVYASIGEGYKGGGLNVSVLSGALASRQGYLPERALNYEIGYKGNLAKGRLQINLAAFYLDYRDLQVFITDPQTLQNYIGNASKARSFGLEAEANARLSRNLQITGAVGWTDAEYIRFAECSQSGSVDCDGRRLSRAPSVTASLRADWRVELGGFKLGFTPDISYTGPTYFDPFNFEQSRRAGYVLIGGEIALAPASGPWSFSLWAKNLAEEDYFTDAIESPNPFGPSVWRYTVGPPRTYGVRARMSF
jgi:iron complex outermembrane recepter protein